MTSLRLRRRPPRTQSAPRRPSCHSMLTKPIIKTILIPFVLERTKFVRSTNLVRSNGKRRPFRGFCRPRPFGHSGGRTEPRETRTVSNETGGRSMRVGGVAGRRRERRQVGCDVSAVLGRAGRASRVAVVDPRGAPRPAGLAKPGAPPAYRPALRGCAGCRTRWLRPACRHRRRAVRARAAQPTQWPAMCIAGGPARRRAARGRPG